MGHNALRWALRAGPLLPDDHQHLVLGGDALEALGPVLPDFDEVAAAARARGGAVVAGGDLDAGEMRRKLSSAATPATCLPFTMWLLRLLATGRGSLLRFGRIEQDELPFVLAIDALALRRPNASRASFSYSRW